MCAEEEVFEACRFNVGLLLAGYARGVLRCLCVSNAVSTDTWRVVARRECVPVSENEMDKEDSLRERERPEPISFVGEAEVLLRLGGSLVWGFWADTCVAYTLQLAGFAFVYSAPDLSDPMTQFFTARGPHEDIVKEAAADEVFGQLPSSAIVQIQLTFSIQNRTGKMCLKAACTEQEHAIPPTSHVQTLAKSDPDPLLRWVEAPGDLVERLLDDVSDIWSGAIIVKASNRCLLQSSIELYDITYADNGSLERDVEVEELRPRKVACDMPSEVWTFVGGCLGEKQDLVAFEALSRNPGTAAREKAHLWWCSVYHRRFGRCGPRCSFSFVSGAEGCAAAAQAVAICVATAILGQTPLDRLSWKARYQDQEVLTKPDWNFGADSNGGTPTAAPGDAAYSCSGKKATWMTMDGRLRYGSDAITGSFFDPRLGCMVREH
ncbi:unnamed protein product [Polarella glacialis]|uniref:Uncharacterized protein n=1 Tax=Polarella glacialis TaxID=89957 RepID=A0A813FI38_POLGL|nr:unnamed protein product [Polarella glacialis]CAE8621769.1 unnamed protein product [Polarella glacialis]